MASSKTRQRKLERDRYERKLARRAQQQRRRRRVRSGLGAAAIAALLGVGTAWQMGVFEPAPPERPLADRCFWQEHEGEHLVDVGTPDPNPPTEGFRRVTLDLDAGDAGSGEVEIAVNVAGDPCGTATVEYLAAEGFYDGTTCHELTAEGALRCGDPSGTGEGGPAYIFYGQNLPVPPPDPTPTPTPGPTGTPGPTAAPTESPEAPETAAPEDTADPLYPAGTVVFADVAGANNSQFMIFYEDYDPEGPVWPILGTVTSGLDLVAAIGEAGTDGDPPGPPAQEVQLRSVTVTDPAAEGGGAEDS